MNTKQIEFLKSLDPNGIDGTIQIFLMQKNLNEIPFEAVAKEIMKNLVNEKRFLVSQNIRLSLIAKECDDWK